MRPEDITKRDIRFLLIRNMYEFDPNLKRAISVISKDEFGGLTFNEKIKFIAGVDPQEEYKAFLSRYIIAQTMRSENIEIAKRDLAFRGEVPDDEKIQEYIINNLRKFNLQLYFYLNSTTNITGNSKAPLNKKFEELGFEREGLRKSAVENLRVLLDPESGLPSMRDSAGFVDQFRKYARLEHAAERLALVLDMPASLVVQLVAGEELASSHVTTEYLTFAKKMFQNYLAENNGEISSIEHKNPRMFYMLVNIARNIETGNLERPSLYEVMKFLGGDALDDSKPHGFVKVSETHAFDRIQAFMKEIKEKFGDTVKPADFVGEYNYQAREVYELANRLGTTASDVYASFGINFEPSL